MTVRRIIDGVLLGVAYVRRLILEVGLEFKEVIHQFLADGTTGVAIAGPVGYCQCSLRIIGPKNQPMESYPQRVVLIEIAVHMPDLPTGEDFCKALVGE